MTEVLRVEDDDDFEKIFRIRKIVFVMEQNVPEEEEWDEFEHISRHYIARYNQIAAGTARWRITMTGDVKLERFAVLAEYRGHGVGEALVRALLADVPKREGYKIYLHAQIQVQKFYERFGFVPEGELFDEAGITHVKMVWKGKNDNPVS
ncbi:MAG: GNAT family N-acetyltransferase [Bacteroidia bacterium]|nr:GNAT family N-acetyltransferase [Bacteroidia bacterium]